MDTIHTRINGGAATICHAADWTGEAVVTYWGEDGERHAVTVPGAAFVAAHMTLSAQANVETDEDSDGNPMPWAVAYNGIVVAGA